MISKHSSGEATYSFFFLKNADVLQNSHPFGHPSATRMLVIGALMTSSSPRSDMPPIGRYFCVIGRSTGSSPISLRKKRTPSSWQM